MRILFTIHAVLDPNAGAASVIVRLAEQFRTAGHSVETLSYSDFPDRIPMGARQILFPWKVASHLARHAGDYDVVDASTGDAWIAYGRRRAPRPLHVTHSHGLEQLLAVVEREEAGRQGGRPPLHTRVWRHGLRLREVSLSLRRADLCLVLNDAERRLLEEAEGIPAERIARARLGTPFAEAVEGADVADPALDRAVIVQIGTYAARKGVAATAAGMQPLLRRYPGLRLRFVGTIAPRETVLADYPPELHDRIEVVPRYANAELRGLLSDARIQLMPSRFEGYGIAKLEGMACGLVVIASDDPGTATDVQDGETGLVVPVGDGPAMEAAVARLIEDPGLWRRLRANAMAMVGEFTWPRVAAERLALYEKHLARLKS